MMLHVLLFGLLTACLLNLQVHSASVPILSNSNHELQLNYRSNFVQNRINTFDTNRNKNDGHTLTSACTATRGGASLSITTPQSQREIAGATLFILLDIAFRKFFKAQNISFPSQLAGCMCIFATLVLVDLLQPGLGEFIFQSLSPGAGLLAKWLPVFFVPGLAMLPLAPSVGGTSELLKVFAVIVLGFLYTLSTTAFSVLSVRKMLGTAVLSPKTSVGTSTTNTTTKPFSQELVNFLFQGFIASSAISIAATKLSSPFAIPLQTLFFSFATIAGYVFGARLPPNFVKFVHPLVTSTAVTLSVIRLTSIATGRSFLEVLQKYKVGSLSPMSAGTGDFLLYLLGPSVVSFSMSMFSRRKVMVENLLAVFTSMMVASVGGLFGTAAFVRLIQLGGTAVGGRLLRLSVLSRFVTTPLAIAIANILGGNMSIAAGSVVVTGIIGGTFGGSILTSLGIHDPVSRGLGIGAAAQGVGVASFVNEKEAFPFAAISMVLTAVAATTLVSIPAIKNILMNIALGN